MESIDRLLEKRSLRTRRDPYPLASFYEKIERARLLLNHAETKSGTSERKIKSEARRQFAIALVTALEVYLGDLTIELIDKNTIRYGRKVLETIRVKYDIIQVKAILSNKITVGELIAEECNFQNLDWIFSFLQTLFGGTSFAKLCRTHKFTYAKSNNQLITISLRKGFEEDLRNLINLRHDFVHDIRFDQAPSIEDLKRYHSLLSNFTTAIDVRADQIRKIETSKIVKK